MVSATGKPTRSGALRGIAGDAHHPGHALDDLVVGREVSQRAVLAEAGDRAVDQPRVLPKQIGMPKAQAAHYPRAEILHDHVGAAHQATEDLLALLGLEVERDRALAGILGQERDTHVGLVQRRVSAELTRQIACAARLDLNDIGAHVRQLVAGKGAGQHVRQIEDAHALKWLDGHRGPFMKAEAG